MKGTQIDIMVIRKVVGGGVWIKQKMLHNKIIRVKISTRLSTDGRWRTPFRQAPQGCFWDAYRVNKAYIIDVCSIRGWIFSKEELEKQVKPEKKK